MSAHRAVRPTRRRSAALALGGFAALGLLVPTAGVSMAAGNLNCDDFRYQEDAQAHYNKDKSDPDGLDGNPKDGKACESLPHRPSSAANQGVTTRPQSSTGTSTRTTPSQASTGSSSRTIGAVASSGSSHGPAVSQRADRDCEDFDSQAEAQDALDANPDDPDRLDADDDGQACESYDYGTSGSSSSSDDGSDDTATVPAASDSSSDVPVGGVAAGDGSAPADVHDLLGASLLGGAALVGGAGVYRHRRAQGRHRAV